MAYSSHLLRNILLTGGLATYAVTSAAAVAIHIPGSVVPGRIQQEIVPLPRPEPATQIHYADFPTSKIELQFHKKTPRLRRVLIRDQNRAFPSQLANLYRPYIGYYITAKNVGQLADAVAQFYRQHGYFAAQVVVPEQNLRDGILELSIFEGTVSDVQIDNKSPRIQSTLQHYADEIKKLNPVTRHRLERNILLAGELVGVHLKADVIPDAQRPGCVKVALIAALQRVGADVGYDNYAVRWQGPQQWAANVFGNSVLQAGDHTQVNVTANVEGDELRYYAAEHDMPLGYAGTRLKIWANYAENDPGFRSDRFDIDGEALSAGIVASHPLVFTQTHQFWARVGLRFIDEELEFHNRHSIIKDSDRVALATVDYDWHDCWQGETRAQLTVSHGFSILGAHALSRFHGKTDFTKLNGDLSYTRPIVDNFSFMVGGQGQYGFDPLLVSELMGVGGRYWGRAYDWSEIMGDSGVVGTAELRYDTKPGAPEQKNTQYFLAYDAGTVWKRYAPDRAKHDSLSSLQAGLRLDFTRYLSADLVVAKPLTRDVRSQELAGHHGDKIRAFFRIALHA